MVLSDAFTGNSGAPTADDALNFVKYGAIGFLAFGGLKASQFYASRNLLPSSQLAFETECFHLDHELLEQFLVLQKYMKLNAWAYQMALTNTDCILYLLNALNTDAISPTASDKILAFTYFRVTCKRLDSFAASVEKTMATKHKLVVHMAITQIKQRLKQHVVNILSLCSQFNPAKLIARAETEVSLALDTINK